MLEEGLGLDGDEQRGGCKRESAVGKGNVEQTKTRRNEGDEKEEEGNGQHDSIRWRTGHMIELNSMARHGSCLATSDRGYKSIT